MSDRILVCVRYVVKEGKRNEFLKKVDDQGIIRESKAEPGNVKYEYSVPMDSESDLILTEIWANSEAQTEHGKTEHYQRLQALKKEYVQDVLIEKYHITAI